MPSTSPTSPLRGTGKSQGRTLPSVQQLCYYLNCEHQPTCSDPLLGYKYFRFIELAPFSYECLRYRGGWVYGKKHNDACTVKYNVIM
jgi:hypothetical protein